MKNKRLQIKLETEKKFYLKNEDQFELMVEELGFKKMKIISEIDEYFTDIESEFVKNRTCLRLRKTNNKELELTFKGRSKDLSNVYAKLENNIKLSLKEYEEIKILFFNLGFYAYSKVEKERQTYTKKEDAITYNILIDEIKGVGNFVEFEILVDLKVDHKIAYQKLNKLIKKFKDIELEEASLPYRDFVAKELYKKIKPKEKLKNIVFDLDMVLNRDEDILEMFLFFKLLKQLKEKGFKIELITKESIKDKAYVLKQLEAEDTYDFIANLNKEKNLKSGTISFIDVFKNRKFDFEELIRNMLYIINFN